MQQGLQPSGPGQPPLQVWRVLANADGRRATWTAERGLLLEEAWTRGHAQGSSRVAPGQVPEELREVLRVTYL